jgi:enamine deaminase RidA (YjgF/YER057c/UK114 family)
MEKQSRRSLLKGAMGAAAIATAGAVTAEKVTAQTTGKLGKRSPLPPATPQTGAKPLYSSVVAFGNLLFLSGVGAHFKGTIQDQTKWVLDELEKTLAGSGSSLQNVLKVSVFLNDIKDFDGMNSVYGQRNWGTLPPARTTVSPAGGLPGENALVEIDMIAYI